MDATQLWLATLFADIEGSTQLYDQLGDTRAHNIMTVCVQRISGLVTQFGGRVIKTIGDEVMATFPSAAQAAAASCEIQLSMGEPLVADPAAASIKIRVHIGFHFGPVLEEARDVFGDSVNVAARLVGLAKSGQILTTLQTADAMGTGEGIPSARRIDRRRVKGKQEELEICEVIWQKAGLTALISIPSEESLPGRSRLILNMADQELEVGSDLSQVSIGRASEADLFIDDSRASRWHAQIEFRQGNFVLRDNSTNGTYVTPDAGQPVRVHREEMVLSGAGNISVSGNWTGEGCIPIFFRCESS